MQQKVKNLMARAKILYHIRKWFNKEQFVEVETPILVESPDLSPNFNILTTEIHPATEGAQFIASQPEMKKTALQRALITSPEFSMKKILALPDLEKIYTITKVFRDNEGDTGIHSIEFTMLEWYRKGADYNQIMSDTENIINYTAQKLKNTMFFSLPWPRFKVSELFKKYAKIESVEKLTLAEFKKIIYKRNYSQDKSITYEQCFNLIFLNEIETRFPKDKPFFVIDYPAPLAALAKLKRNNKFIAERFELYLNGMELCNGFSELTDGKEQLTRFKKENAERKKIGKPVFPIDYELCEKLDLIGKAGGNALGIDRLIMVLLGIERIEDIVT